MALKATLEPILMRDRRAVMMQERAMALAGICFFGSTYEIHLENGRPLSRAKAKVWRAVEALKETLLAMTRMRTRIVRALTPAVGTALRKT